MKRPETSKDVCASCEERGFLIKLEDVDAAKIKHMVSMAMADIECSNLIISAGKKDSYVWSSVYKLQYDCLHQLIEALIRFDRVKSNNHQCLFAYVCEKHPELELDWAFLEKIRTKRNGIHYYGVPATWEDWKAIELQAALHIRALKKAIEKNLSG